MKIITSNQVSARSSHKGCSFKWIFIIQNNTRCVRRSLVDKSFNCYNDIKQSRILLNLTDESVNRCSTLFMIAMNNIINRPQETTLLRNQRRHILCFIYINSIRTIFTSITTASGQNRRLCTLSAESANLNQTQLAAFFSNRLKDIRTLRRSKVNVNIRKLSTLFIQETPVRKIPTNRVQLSNTQKIVTQEASCRTSTRSNNTATLPEQVNIMLKSIEVSEQTVIQLTTNELNYIGFNLKSVEIFILPQTLLPKTIEALIDPISLLNVITLSQSTKSRISGILALGLDNDFLRIIFYFNLRNRLFTFQRIKTNFLTQLLRVHEDHCHIINPIRETRSKIFRHFFSSHDVSEFIEGINFSFAALRIQISLMNWSIFWTKIMSVSTNNHFNTSVRGYFIQSLINHHLIFCGGRGALNIKVLTKHSNAIVQKIKHIIVIYHCVFLSTDSRCFSHQKSIRRKFSTNTGGSCDNMPTIF